MMRVLGLVLATGVLLTACGGGAYSGELAFRVTAVNPESESMGRTEPAYVNLEIDQDVADERDLLEIVRTQRADLDQLPTGVKVGDRVQCHVNQSDDSGFDQKGVQTEVTHCVSRS
ncbi:hypothetical protein [Actinosynnema sp. NPDC020468]|uniref:hypothetical protein n=1 Tax=Actinosynnema sp. NPDC020468 TaxID=3154488 RepID=UPI0033F58F62